MRILKLTGVVVALLGLAAAAIVVAPIVYGQTVVRKGDSGVARFELFGRGTQIGVAIRDVDEADVSREKLPTPAGAVVTEVRTDTPAATAGLRSGDVIVEFDGERIRSARQLSRLIEETVAGRTVKAALMRDGRRVDVEITPEAPRAYQLFGGEAGRMQALERLERLNVDIPRFDFDFDMPALQLDMRLRVGRLGMTFQQLTPQLAEYFGAKNGVLVTNVTEGSASATAGLKAGDVITAVNGASVANTSDLRRALQRLDPGAEFSLTILRDRKEMTLKGKADQSRSSSRRTIRTWF